MNLIKMYGLDLIQTNLVKTYGLDLIPKLNWEFFFGSNVGKPVKDLFYGYTPEGYDQQKEEEAHRNRNKE